MHSWHHVKEIVLNLRACRLYISSQIAIIIYKWRNRTCLVNMSTEHSTINSWFIQNHGILHVITISQVWFHHIKQREKKMFILYWKAYPVYDSTATIAFVPDGNSSIWYLLYVAVRTIGVWGVYRAPKTVKKVRSTFQQPVLRFSRE